MWADLGGYAGTRHSLDDEAEQKSQRKHTHGKKNLPKSSTQTVTTADHPLLQKAESVKDLLRSCNCGLWGLLPLEELLFSMFLVGMEGVEVPYDESTQSNLFHPLVYELRDVALVSQLSRLISMPKALGSLLAGELKPRPLQLHFAPPELLKPISPQSDKGAKYRMNLIDYNVKTDAGCLRPCIAAASSGWVARAIESLFFKKGEAVHPSVPSLENMNSAAGMFGNIPLLEKIFEEPRPSQGGERIAAGCAALTAACSVGDVATSRWILNRVATESDKQTKTDPEEKKLAKARALHSTLTSSYSGMVPTYTHEEKSGHWIHAASPMHAALRSRCVSLVSFLLKEEASVRNVLSSYYLEKHSESIGKGDEDKHESLSQVNSRSSFKHPQGFVLLAAEIGSLPLMKTLHEEVEGGGFDFAERSNEGLTPLMVAGASGDFGLVQFLLHEVGAIQKSELPPRGAEFESICFRLHKKLGLYLKDTVVEQDALQWAEGSDHPSTIKLLRSFFPKPDCIEV